MRKLSIDQFAYRVSPAGIGEKNTVSNGADDGANNKLASHLWNCARHGTTQQAIDFASSALVFNITPSPEITASGGGLNLGGHGDQGFLETGAGQNGPFSDPLKYIYLYNEDSWGPQLDRINPTRITMISIWSCHVGAGQDGADLLYAMAKRSGRAVRAGTGLLLSSDTDTWWENGSVQQVATPTHKPDAISAPGQHAPMITADRKFEGEGREYTIADVTDFEIIVSPILGQAKPSKKLHGQPAQHIVGAMFVGMPMEMSASVAGMITAKIKLTFSDGRFIEFVVYNNRLAVDLKSRTAYYIASGLNTLYEAI
jgi:hypothetical protein